MPTDGHRTLPRLIVVMGVAGSGKSTVGAALADRLGVAYLDGDAYHPPSNIAKMESGIPLSDDDRWPWLERFAGKMAARTGRIVGGCSALKHAYRDHIRNMAGEPVLFVYLDGSHELIASRMGARQGHFMPTTLLDSQFATLELPAADEAALTVSIDGTTDAIVSDIIKAMDSYSSNTGR